ncbi:methyl-accepting chemotaxis protein [Clostridium butyricum]|uniref:methyl-accepting chemotaxis protein n=1 Tax=Clostridium butyricum TaxID=1492 RepID=UPI0013D25698|nr:methyl-accepting chemotaxis protein [Clostridium butyricum]MCQ2016434.1 methyl-accepting chemotaxis protein [Clostridium butyricum]MCQ2020439.1 methyl-accepting chemotaxis protein [Clostridium butyricum]NFB72279.1 methyl-accepting chemotaxis protein [Clostridium butyricum]NFB92467.1 methyl-accepting chemotaxis protein [Clostridium butyricum]UTY54477.1 methyl-accepting chemotaxis protein [Clostridium butyricum]
MEKLKRSSFKLKLLSGILPIVIIGMGILSFYTVYKFNESIENSTIKRMTENVNNMSDIINEWIDGKLLEVRSTANTPTAKLISSNIEAVDEFNKNRILNLEKDYPGEYDNAAVISFNNDGISRAQYANGKTVNGDVSEKQWYKDLMTGRSYNISNPVISKGSGKTLIVIGAAVKDDSDNIIGDMISAVNISRIQEKINEFKFGENGYSILISDDGTIITHPDESLIMKSKITELDDSDMVNLGKEMLKSDSGDFKFGVGDNKSIAFYKKIPLTNWSVASVISERELFAEGRSLVTTLAMVSVIIIIIIAGIIIFMANKFSKPLRKLCDFSSEIAQGNLTCELNINRSDEIGQVADTLKNTSYELRNMVIDISTSANEVNKLADDVNEAIKQSLLGSEEITKSMEQISRGAINQAENADKASEITGELVDEIKSVVDKCNYMNEIVNDSIKMSTIGTERVQNAVENIKSIEKINNESIEQTLNLLEKSNEIGQIVNVISEIAEQTNLLALNASIEAARAGEQGKGFAVVASQVGELAKQSNEAAKKIENIIRGIQQQVQVIDKQMKFGAAEVANGVETTKSVSENFTEIEKTFKEIESVVLEVFHASNIMEEKAHTTSNSIKEVAGVTEENSSATEEVTAANEEQSASMQQIAETTSKLDELIENLNETIKKFKI